MYRNVKIYQAITRRKKQRYNDIQESNPTYIPAPPPPSNYWHERAQMTMGYRQEPARRNQEAAEGLVDPREPSLTQEMEQGAAEGLTRPGALPFTTTKQGAAVGINNPREPSLIQEDETRKRKGAAEGPKDPRMPSQHPRMCTHLQGASRNEPNSQNQSQDEASKESDTVLTSLTDFDKLCIQVTRLNKKININRFVKLLVKLNDQLENAQSDIEKFQIMVNVTSQINEHCL